MTAITPRLAVALLAVVGLPATLLVAPAIAQEAPPMPPIGDVDTTTPPPGAPTTDEIGLPPPPPDLGGMLPTPLPELPPLPTEPCYPGGGPLLLRMSPAYAKISPTSSVTLSARLLQDGRVCQSGLTVGLYARGPGGTVFHLSRTLSTDGQGLVRTTYVRPRGDFRWYARSVTELGAISSAVGLVQVR